MNRRPIQALVVTAAAIAAAYVPAGAGAASAQTGSGTASASPSAQLTNAVCHHALNPVKRSVAATAVIHPTSGSAKLAVDFHLFRRTPGGTFTAVPGAGLNTWLTKQLGKSSDAWRVIHTVSDLSAPAVYRFKVGFRWIGASGQILAQTTRSGRICHQPELRPDLEVKTIQVLPDSANAQDDVYRAQIYDAGLTGAGPFRVELADQGTTSSRRVLRIRAHRSAWVRLIGPVCNSSAPPTVTADPNHRVDVYTRAQAVMTATCPAATSGTSAA